MYKRNCFVFLVVLTLLSCTYENKIVDQTEVTKWQNGKSAAISITYDDGTINHFRKAIPIMDSLGFKGTFFLNTGEIPGSKYRAEFFGRSLELIVKESAKKPTTKENLFERASALRFLNLENAVEFHNQVGSLYEQNEVEEVFHLVDSAFSLARNLAEIRKTRPVVLEGERITWDEIRAFAANGHEFGNHTISHPRLAVLDKQNLLYELEKGKEEILNQLGPKETFSAECPFGTENERVMHYAYKIHPALRNRMPELYLEELNRWNRTPPGEFKKKEYVQWQRGPLKRHTLEEMKSWVDTLITHDNVWLVLTFHGIDGVGWEAKPHEELQAYFTYMKDLEDKLWVTTFRDVTKYMRERMKADVITSSKGGTIHVNLTHSLDKSIYAFPLTLKTYVDWGAVSIKQGNNELSYVKGKDQKGRFIMYNAMPNSKRIEITKQ